ncbi:hypothetical protein [Chroococcidiopsis sp.]
MTSDQLTIHYTPHFPHFPHLPHLPHFPHPILHCSLLAARCSLL